MISYIILAIICSLLYLVDMKINKEDFE